jgi:hypothetical protein
VAFLCCAGLPRHAKQNRDHRGESLSAKLRREEERHQ